MIFDTYMFGGIGSIGSIGGVGGDQVQTGYKLSVFFSFGKLNARPIVLPYDDRQPL